MELMSKKVFNVEFGEMQCTFRNFHSGGFMWFGS